MIPDAKTERVKEWAAKHGFTLKITNRDQHWSFYKESKQVFEWWPSSGKMVIEKDWAKAEYIRNVDGLFATIEKQLDRFYK
jgi:hypothetical protein